MSKQKLSQQPAVVLYSGGLDSTTCLAIAQSEGLAPYALSFDYGQRHNQELAHARYYAHKAGAVEHKVLSCDLGQLGGSALTTDSQVPKDDYQEGRIPSTYVPARNTVFLSLALAWAEVLGAADIFIGANVRDYSGYPDCRPAYLDAYAYMANLATRAAVAGDVTYRIRSPLLHLTKGDIIRWGHQLGVDYSLTHSCYDPVAGQACGRCDACHLRLKGFAEAGLTDPLPYAEPEGGA